MKSTRLKRRPTTSPASTCVNRQHEILFDRACLNKPTKKEPVKTLADFKVFYSYDPSHRYGIIAGGVGLDGSTSVFIDFSTIPARVVGTFQSSTIKPDTFGDEIERSATMLVSRSWPWRTTSSTPSAG
jgi:hypothetical protein